MRINLYVICQLLMLELPHFNVNVNRLCNRTYIILFIINNKSFQIFPNIYIIGFRKLRFTQCYYLILTRRC